MIKILMKHFFPNFILVSSLIYIWHKLMNIKINFKDWKLYVTTIGIMGFSIANYLITNKFIKITLITIIFMFFFRFLFKENIQKCIITPIYYQLIIMISETLFALFLTVFLEKDVQTLLNTYLGAFITNIIIAIISTFISNIKIVKKLYQKLIKISEFLKLPHLVIFSLVLVFISNILAMTMYYKIPFKYLMLFNVCLTLVCSIIFIYSFKTQNSYNKVSDKYNIAINSLKDYEEMMSKYRIANHENKNLLLAVRAMIMNKDKEIPEYIDSIIKDKYSDNEKLLMKVNVIPSGGLRATIYSEILKIKDKKINYNLSIDKKLKTVDLIELDTNTIINICKIIGVFIDNAIEEVYTLQQKNIGINLYLEDNLLNIEVSNNYRNTIDIDKIYDKGYTTKGKGHGYGLSLVKKS